jgi:hypothetical protein
MYLTKINDANIDLYKDHQMLGAIFGTNHPPRYQLMGSTLVTVSAIMPNVNGHDFRTKDITQFVRGIQDGFETMFTVRMAAMRRDIKTRKLVPIPRDYIKDSLAARFAKAGFNAMFSYDIEGSAKVNKPDHEHATLSVMCSGGLKVIDASLFKRALLNGVPGPEKSFGFGFLNVYHFLP